MNALKEINVNKHNNNGDGYILSSFYIDRMMIDASKVL